MCQDRSAGKQFVSTVLPEQDAYAELESWAHSRWTNAGERVFEWSGEVRCI